MIRKYFNIALVGIVLSLLSSCFSIRYDMKGASIDPSIQTISVQYFNNRAQRIEPQLSQNFTDALRDFMESNTNLRMITGAGDVDFSGEVVGYTITPTAITSGSSGSPGDFAAQTRFTIRIKVRFVNSINPDDDYEETFSRFRDFDSSSDFTAVEAELTEEIIEEMVEMIYNRAFVNW